MSSPCTEQLCKCVAGNITLDAFECFCIIILIAFKHPNALATFYTEPPRSTTLFTTNETVCEGNGGDIPAIGFLIPCHLMLIVTVSYVSTDDGSENSRKFLFHISNLPNIYRKSSGGCLPLVEEKESRPRPHHAHNISYHVHVAGHIDWWWQSKFKDGHGQTNKKYIFPLFHIGSLQKL